MNCTRLLLLLICIAATSAAPATSRVNDKDGDELTNNRGDSSLTSHRNFVIVDEAASPEGTSASLVYHDEDDNTNIATNLLKLDLDESDELPPLFPLTSSDYLGLGAATLGLILAAGGGVGGGGILIPVFVLLLDFPISHAVPLVSVTVLGGAVANNLLNAWKPHPSSTGRGIVDWFLILNLEPITMAGAIVGADLNDALPDIVLVVAMALFLALVAWKTLTKAKKLYAEETKKLLSNTSGRSSRFEKMSAPTQSDDTLRTNSNEDDTTECLIPSGSSEGESYGSFRNDPETLTSSRRRRPLWHEAAKLTILFIVVTAISMLKGGRSSGGGPVGVASCGVWCFRIAEATMILLIVGFSLWYRSSLLQRIDNGEEIPSDVSWNAQNTITYPLYALTAGLVAGLFGIGGGIVKGPLMLSLGVHPVVASATSACMIFFTSSTATVSYMGLGDLAYDYAAACLLLGFVATALGQTVMNGLLQRYQRHSYIAYCIGIVVALSAVCMTYASVQAILSDAADGKGGS